VGIDDVRVAHTLDEHELLGVAGRRDRGVGQGRRAGAHRPAALGDRDPPAGEAGRGIARHDVAARLEQRACDPVPPQLGERLVQDVPLGDAAQIEPHAGHGEPHGARGRVEMNLLRSHAQGRGVELGAPRQPARAARGAPQLGERPHGGIERAAAPAPQVEGAGDDGKQLAAHPDRLPGSRPQPPHLALGAVVAHNILELRHASVGGPRGPARRRLVPGVEHDPHGDAHVQLDILATDVLGPRLGGWARDRGNGEENPTKHAHA
jgi:hypothetical protein